VARKLICLAVSLILVMVAAPSSFSNINLQDVTCEAFMFKNEESLSPVSEFTPRDKVVIRIKFKDLKPGHYTVHTDWYNPLGKLQEKSAFSFQQKRQASFSAQSWIQLKRAGFMKRLFTVSNSGGYNMKFYGEWRVVVYLNGEEMVAQKFKVI
jgi:hypothetical protein